jgi:hypothetical protein
VKRKSQLFHIEKIALRDSYKEENVLMKLKEMYASEKKSSKEIFFSETNQYGINQASRTV